MIRNMISLAMVVSILNFIGLQDVSLPSVSAMEFNQKQKLHKQLLDKFVHPIVRQEEDVVVDEEGEGETVVEEVVEEEPWYNNTNLFNYPFNNYSIYEEFRRDFDAFLAGANANYFASNATTCF